jgi:hypothetical protein
MGKWAMRALVPIVGSNEQQLEHIITHNLFGKVKKSIFFIIMKNMNIFIDKNFLVVN